MSNPWEVTDIWKTKAEYYQWLRGALRRLWSDYPLRKQWKKNQLRSVTKEEKQQKLFHPSTKNVGQCHYCEKWFPGSKLEVDHKIASDGCYDYETAVKFLWYCGGQDGTGWVLACKPCHTIKTHQERYGFDTFEEAAADKDAIAFCKLSQDAQGRFFKEHGLPYPSNQKARREAYKRLKMEEKI